jgi:hypothetical protein
MQRCAQVEMRMTQVERIDEYTTPAPGYEEAPGRLPPLPPPDWHVPETYASNTSAATVTFSPQRCAWCN